MWDYLILTASNAEQAAAYESQLSARRELGLLPRVREALVVADPDGKRIGSGGSTLYCLKHVLTREREKLGKTARVAQAVSPVLPDYFPASDLRGLRILIVHAGGDSRRLPAYGPCGKIFVPIPGPADAALPPTLFDRLVPGFLALQGQIVVAAGDALILFDPAAADFSRPGITALGCYASPEEAARHGVFCTGPGGVLTKFLQKPSIAEQSANAALVNGRAALDIGVMNIDADTAAALLAAFGDSYYTHAIDLYREICCALGAGATLEHYLHSGSALPADALTQIHAALRNIPFHVSMLPDCRFLHFGSTRQLIESGVILQKLAPQPAESDLLILNSTVRARITGAHSWIEGCRIDAPVELAGSNAIIGADIGEPLNLPHEACLDILRARDGSWFIRCYGIRDGFKEGTEPEAIRMGQGAQFCGRPLLEWLAAAGVSPAEIWPHPADQTLWSARVFPAESSPAAYRNWLWMFTPESATAAQKHAYRAARRYSAAEIALLADQDAFHRRRRTIWRQADVQ